MLDIFSSIGYSGITRTTALSCPDPYTDQEYKSCSYIILKFRCLNYNHICRTVDLWGVETIQNVGCQVVTRGCVLEFEFKIQIASPANLTIVFSLLKII